MKKTFVIGDIHGCNVKFNDLLQKVAPTKDDRIILLGDYIDRGLDSRGVIDTILWLIMGGYDVIPLMGNHEEILLGYVEDPHVFIYYWFNNGGDFTRKSYENPFGESTFLENMAKHLTVIKDFRVCFEDEAFFYAHAGVDPEKSLKDQDVWDLLWIRRKFVETTKDFGKVVVFGHTPLKEPLIMRNKIGIDTGCVFGGKLTCLELPNLTFQQV